MGQSFSHEELGAHHPDAQAAKGLLLQYEEKSGKWRQVYCVLHERKLHGFAGEASALDWANPTILVDMRYTFVRRYEPETYQSEQHPDGTIVVQTPKDARRLDLQDGETTLVFRPFEDDVDWLQLLRLASREPWQPDSAASSGCSPCSSQWDVINRRHHCRRCGAVVCDPCSASRKPLPDYGYRESVRVCSRCFSQDGPVQSPEDVAASAAAESAMVAQLRRALDGQLGAPSSSSGKRSTSAATGRDSTTTSSSGASTPVGIAPAFR